MERRAKRRQENGASTDVASEATELLRQTADEIDGNPLWYRSNGWADYFVMGNRMRGSHFGRRGNYINRMTGLPFFLDVEPSEFDRAYRCADGQLRLTAVRVLRKTLWIVEESPSYQLAYRAATRTVMERTRSACNNLEVFNDDPNLCEGSTAIAALFRQAAARLEGVSW